MFAIGDPVKDLSLRCVESRYPFHGCLVMDVAPERDAIYAVETAWMHRHGGSIA